VSGVQAESDCIAEIDFRHLEIAWFSAALRRQPPSRAASRSVGFKKRDSGEVCVGFGERNFVAVLGRRIEPPTSAHGSIYASLRFQITPRAYEPEMNFGIARAFSIDSVAFTAGESGTLVAPRWGLDPLRHLDPGRCPGLACWRPLASAASCAATESIKNALKALAKFCEIFPVKMGSWRDTRPDDSAIIFKRRKDFDCQPPHLYPN
jgi:hypothetical protein